jgi:hypothetical protein
MTTGRAGCDGCVDADRRCDACVARWVAIHERNAAATGRWWVRQIIARTGDRSRARPWPAWEASELLRAAAVRESRHLAGADVRIRERLGRLCADAAAAAYEAWRAGGNDSAGGESRFP